jgi:hypothetical protein
MNPPRYSFGKGILKFDRLDDLGLPTGLRDLGNVREFSIMPSIEPLEHFSARKGIPKKRSAPGVLIGAEIEFVLDEFDLDNLAFSLFGKHRGGPVEFNGPPEGELRFEAVGEGPRFIVTIWRVRLIPPQDDFTYFLDRPEYGELKFKGEVLADIVSHRESPYFTIEEAGMAEERETGVGRMFMIEVAKNGWIVREQDADSLPVLAMCPDELIKALSGDEVEYKRKERKPTGKIKKNTRHRR